MQDKLIVAGHELASRLIVGTGKYPDFETMRRCHEVSGAEMVTVALGRVKLDGPEGRVTRVRIIERVNLEDFGPEIFGVDAWVRLNSCSGWLVINMTPACYIRQTYTRGDCRVDGVTDY